MKKELVTKKGVSPEAADSIGEYVQLHGEFSYSVHTPLLTRDCLKPPPSPNVRLC